MKTNPTCNLLTAFHFEVFGSQVLRNCSNMSQRDTFHANFGVSPKVCLEVYKKIVYATGVELDPNSMLLTFFFLKVYPTTRVLSTISGKDRHSIMSEIWCIISIIAHLKKDVVSEKK